MKAYKLTADIADEPWHWDDVIVYAETRGEAKSKGLKEFSEAEIKDYTSYFNYRDVQFTDIRAKRVPEYDKVFFDGKYRTIHEVKALEWQTKRDKEAFNLTVSNPNDFAVIFAGCYGAYWGANKSGYTSSLEKARRYTTKEAYDIVRGSDYRRQETVILLDKAEWNADIDLKIKELEASRI